MGSHRARHAVAGLDARLVALGARLFDERRLSGDGAVACSDCHAERLALTDGKAIAEAAGRPRHLYNTPTLYDVGLLDRYNWTGRFASLEEHSRP